MENLSKLLPAIAQLFPDSPEVREAVVFAIWRQIAGEGLRGHAIPISLEDKVLRVAVRDNVWKKHLKGLAPELLAKLNRKLEAKTVTYLEFIIDEIRFADRKIDGPPETATAPDEPPAELVAKATEISDPELRKLFLKSANAYIAAQQRRERRKNR